MASKQQLSDTLINYVLLSLYIITGTLPNFTAIDILAPQWIYLGAINILSAFYFLIYRRDQFALGIKPLSSSYFFSIYCFYLFWNGLSYFYAINNVETLINLPRIFNTFSAIVFSFILIYNIPNKFVFISRLLLAFLTLELLAYYNDFIEQYNQPNFSVINLKGFAGNKNITAASIAFKVPFVLYILYSANTKILRAYSFLLLVPSILALSVIEARSAILSSLIVFILFVLFLVYQIISKSVQLKKGLVGLFLIILPYFLAYGLNIAIATKTKGSNLTETVGKIAFTEKSSNGRFQYWGDALDYVVSNPIFASGLGNWKIASISSGKEHIRGYTVPYHAHNDFVHVFAETGIPGGLAYVSIFGLLTLYLFIMLYNKYREKSVLELQYFFLLLPLIVYGIDAGLNFPVARPLMQSSFAIFAGLVLTLYFTSVKSSNNQQHVTKQHWPFILNIVWIVLLLPAIAIHIISYNSLSQQGRLLYEFNNAKYNYTLAELEEIYDDFPNLTETAMPIKSMKARYYYLNGEREKAFELLDEGQRDNPEIFFSENLRAQFYYDEQKYDSAYVYAKKAFLGLPNNMPHYDLYMKTLVAQKRTSEIYSTFKRVRQLAGDTKTIWLIYLRSLAQTHSLGNPFAMEEAQRGFNLYPDDESIFTLYRILTYGQQRLIQAGNLFNEASTAYQNRDFETAVNGFKQAFDLDPLNYAYALNAGLAYYESGKFIEAVPLFRIAQNSKRADNKERAMRYEGLAFYQAGDPSKSCAVFNRLKNIYPKRMYLQEYQKYCFKNK